MGRIAQICEIAAEHCDIMTRTVQGIHSAAMKGSMTRLYDACPFALGVISICVLVAIVLTGALVWLAYVERKETRTRNASRCEYRPKYHATTEVVTVRGKL